MIEMVVFDMAGTVIDEQNVVYKTLHETLTEAGINTDFETVLALGAGKEKKIAIADLVSYIVGSQDPKLIQDLFDSFRKKLEAAYLNLHILPQPGAETVFEELKKRNILIILNTGYDRPTAESLLEKLEWRVGKEIDYLVTASDVYAGRPEPDMIEKAMEYYDIENEEHVIKVGDSIVDIEEGRNAGCRYVIGVTTGAHNHSQLMSAEPTHIIDHLSELLEIIDDHDNHSF
ncbi:MAG: phosphonatase-like hydrolase [Saprospiraceae bacterium]